MASTFPGSIDSFSNPATNSPLTSPSHAGQHQDLNDAVNKIETYMGLVKVIPTAATNGTIGATGAVTVGNAVASVSVTCFTSLYDNYRIIYTGGVGSVGTQIRLAFNGITTGYYGGYFSTNYSSGAFVGGGDNNTAQFNNAGWVSTSNIYFNVDVTNPFTTGARKNISAYGGFNSNGYGMYHGECTGTASATGFTISPASGTLTGGIIRIYGYRN